MWNFIAKFNADILGQTVNNGSLAMFLRFLGVLSVCCVVIACFACMTSMQDLAMACGYMFAIITAIIPFFVFVAIRYPKQFIMNPEDYLAAEQLAKIETVLRGLCEHAINTEKLVQEIHHELIESTPNSVQEYLINDAMMEALSEKIVAKLINAGEALTIATSLEKLQHAMQSLK